MSDEQLESLTEADRREISLIEHQGGGIFDRMQDRANAAADPATMAVLDALIDAPKEHVPIIRVREGTGYWDTAPDCPNRIARTGTRTEADEWVTDVVMLDCELRSCPVCGPKWASTWAMNVHANFADEVAVVVADVADIEWEAVRKAIRRCGEDDDIYVRIPGAPGRSMVLTSAVISKGRSVSPSEAIRAAEQALDGVTTRASLDRRRVSPSRNFVKPANVRTGSSDPTAVWGQLTRLDSTKPFEALRKLAKATGVSLSSVVRDRDDDPSDATQWRLRGAPLAMQLALARAGHKTDAEIAADRVDRRYASEFEEFLREQRRRPIHNTTIGRARELVAA